MKFSALLISTDIPDITSDHFVKITLDRGSINFYWDNDNTMGQMLEGFNSNTFDINSNDIQKIQIILKPDTPDNFEYSSWNQPDYSTINIFHNDPNNVVPYFTTTIGVDKQYWAHALQKHMKENSSVFVLIGQSEDLIIDFTQLKDFQQFDRLRFNQLVAVMEKTLKGGGHLIIEQRYANAPPDIVTTIKSERGFKYWRQSLNF